MCLSRSWRQKESPSPVALNLAIGRSISIGRSNLRSDTEARSAWCLAVHASAPPDARRAALTRLVGDLWRDMPTRFAEVGPACAERIRRSTEYIVATPRPGGAYVGKGSRPTERNGARDHAGSPFVLFPGGPVLARSGFFSRGGRPARFESSPRSPPPRICRRRGPEPAIGRVR